MPEQESHGDQAKTAFPLFTMPAFATAAQEQFKALTIAQSDLAKKVVEINRHWADRGQSEAGLASEFASKLATTRSLPDAMTTWREWSTQRFERMAEDGMHFLADAQDVLLPPAVENGHGGSS